MNFRTPLNAILNSFEFIESSFGKLKNLDSPNGEMVNSQKLQQMNKVVKQNFKRIKKFLSIGTNSSVLLLSLIEDILDLSKMEVGALKINMTSFKPESIINEWFDLFHYQCKKKVKLNSTIDPQLYGVVTYSDRWRIKQVLLNLLSNSVKFTFEGIIDFGVKIQVESNRKYLVFYVCDTGIGINKDDQKLLFKLFGMISHKNKLNSNGWGIGLTISKKWIEHLDGKIKLESDIGVGTKVVVSIPFLLPPIKPEIAELESMDTYEIKDENKGSDSDLFKSLSEEKYKFNTESTPF
jgi:signal transduction histidine kinase